MLPTERGHVQDHGPEPPKDTSEKAASGIFLNQKETKESSLRMWTKWHSSSQYNTVSSKKSDEQQYLN